MKGEQLSPPLPLAREAQARFEVEESARSWHWRMMLKRLRRNRGALIGLAIVMVVASGAIFAPWLTPYDPNVAQGARLQGPSVEFPLGTDNLGRDILSRLLYGARPSLGSAALATAVILLIGVTVGATVGYIGGIVDDVAMRVVDVLMAFPLLIMALAIVGFLGPGLRNVLLAVILVVWAEYARLVRGLVLELREREFVLAAIAMGAGRRHVIRKHIIPNLISPVIVFASLQMGFLLLTISGLSFLGLGIQPPNPEWGSMLNAARTFFQLAPQLMAYPGLLIMVTVLGFTLLGDGRRDVLDPTQTH